MTSARRARLFSDPLALDLPFRIPHSSLYNAAHEEWIHQGTGTPRPRLLLPAGVAGGGPGLLPPAGAQPLRELHGGLPAAAPAAASALPCCLRLLPLGRRPRRRGRRRFPGPGAV